MNKTIWIFRVIAVVILVVMSILMLNLYTKLRRMSASPRPPVEAPKSVS